MSDNFDSSIEPVTSSFAGFNITEVEMETIVAQIRMLHQHIAEMQEKIATFNNPPKFEEYPEVRVTVTDIKDISLDMFKTLPNFDGDREKYVSWRTAAINAIKIFAGHMEKPKYFEALNIVRNKITGSASNTLTNYNTVFNFDAIISRLDFTYADKRPVYIIEQEMIVLQQKNLSIEEFYDEVNKKLNALINKINMTHKEREVAKAMVQDASEKALRTFVTGLKGNLDQMLYASNPTTLPEASARIQTIVNDQERIRFANQFNQPQNMRNEQRINPNFKPKPKMPYQQYLPNQNNRYESPNRNVKPEPMEVDRSSMNVNVGLQKRQLSGQHSFSNNRKFQRVNQMENQGLDQREDMPTNDEDDNVSGAGYDEEDETSSVFLDN